jgi:4-amino-4-deoxy-L-arabinose transferase-like glycosyltransferase
MANASQNNPSLPARPSRSLFSRQAWKMLWVKHKFLFIILFFSLVLKLIVWGSVLSFNPSSLLWDDAARYQSSALALLRLGEFLINPEPSSPPQYAIPPGYPLLLAITYAIAGEHEDLGIIVNIALSLIIIVLIYWSGITLFSKNAAILAALFLALDFSSFSYSLRLLSETLFTLLLTLVLCTLIQFSRTNDKKWIFITSILLACAAFVRPIGLYLIIPIGFILLGASLVKHWNISKLIMSFLLLFLPFMLMVGAWKVHNYYSLRTWQFCPISGSNIFYYRAAAVVSFRDNISLTEARKYLDDLVSGYESTHPQTATWTTGQYSDFWASQGMKIIRENPILLVKTGISGIIPMLAGGGDGPVLRMLNYPVYTISDNDTFTALKNLDVKFFMKRFSSGISFITFLYAEIYLVVIYLGMALWLLSVLARKDITNTSILIIVIILYFFMISAGPESGSRFRVPVMPFLCLLAASGWVWLGSVVHAKRNGLVFHRAGNSD